MTNLEERPGVVASGLVAVAKTVEVLEPRDVPLGGPRAMTVRRTLPQRRRSLIGAWCFLDSYGPDDVGASGGMRVPGHPHTGLATVTWLFEGEVEHRDTVGTRRIIRAGEVNLMTAGRGIAHSEYSTPETATLSGAQLWLALPDADRSGDRRFENYAAPLVRLGPASVRVFLGDLIGERSPVQTSTRVVGAELLLPAGATLDVPVDATFEHGVLVDRGSVLVEGVGGRQGRLLHLGQGQDVIRLEAGDEGARLLLIGGEPLAEPIVMWWNFVGRSHDEIVAFRTEWQDQLARHERHEPGEEPFGAFPRAWEHVLPAPELPSVRLRPRE